MPLYDEYGQPVPDDQVAAYLQQTQQAPPQQDPPNWRRDLEARAEQAKVEKARADAAERKLAFAEAGVPLAQDPANPNPLVDYFVNGYKGEMTPDAIRAEATKLNLVQPSTPQPTQQVPPPQQTAQQPPFFANATDAQQGQQPGTRDFSGEMKSAPSKEAVIQLAQERAAASGQTQPAVVWD